MGSRIKKTLFVMLTVLGVLLAGTRGAFAVPTLQLDIGGAGYDMGTQTIVSTGDSFTLYAYLIPDSKNTLDDMYYISAAIIPSLSPEGSSLGSFDFNGTAVNVTSDMDYGVPPLESIVEEQGWDAGDLSKHSVFPTFFSEFGFQFSSANAASPYNTQDRAISGGSIDLSPYTPPSPCHGEDCTVMYWAAFDIDVSLLDPEYSVHFDLYNTKLKKGVDVDISQFAPFSHDAESGRASTPEPATLVLLGLGGAGLIAFKKFFPKNR